MSAAVTHLPGLLFAAAALRLGAYAVRVAVADRRTVRPLR